MAKNAGPASSHGSHPLRAPLQLPTDTVLEQAASLLAALADAQRLRLLCILAEGERCVSELVDADHKLSTVSARLKLLHQARLVSRRREARHIFYTLADAHVLNLLQQALAHAGEVTHDSGQNRP